CAERAKAAPASPHPNSPKRASARRTRGRCRAGESAPSTPCTRRTGPPPGCTADIARKSLPDPRSCPGSRALAPPRACSDRGLGCACTRSERVCKLRHRVETAHSRPVKVAACGSGSRRPLPSAPPEAERRQRLEVREQRALLGFVQILVSRDRHHLVDL